jgi:Ulp1 family protease
MPSSRKSTLHPSLFDFTHFFVRGPGGGLTEVERWHKKVDLGTQSYLVIPVNWNK